MRLSCKSAAVFVLLLLFQTNSVARGQTLWTRTGSLNQPRLQTTGILLNDGRVLLIGSLTCTPGCNSFATADIYDPAAGTWSKTSPLNSPPVQSCGGQTGRRPRPGGGRIREPRGTYSQL